jgi:hypothetical protein
MRNQNLCNIACFHDATFSHMSIYHALS